MDKTTISISSAAQEVLTQVVKEHEFFETELGAFLAAAALALANGANTQEDVGPSAGTKWNKGSGAIDEWVAFATWYLPTDEPVRALEQYGEAGLSLVRERLRLGMGFHEIFAPDSNPTTN